MTDDSQVNTTYLSFIISSEKFAVNVGKVLEVLQKQTISPVPNAPEYFKGVINFRGEIIPVIDTRLKLGLPGTQIAASYVIIVIEMENESEHVVVGAVVDRVKDVINIETKDIMPVPKMNRQIQTDFFNGIVKCQDGFIIIINFDKIIAANEAVALSEFTKASSEMLEENSVSEPADT